MTSTSNATVDKKSVQMSTDQDNLEAFLSSQNGKSLITPLSNILSVLQHSKGISSVELVTKTLQLIRSFVGSKRFTNGLEMMSIVRGLGRRLVQARPHEYVIKNCVRRVLFLIREEMALHQGGNEAKVDYRPLMIDAINELLNEVENLIEPISKQALDHIHNGDNILTYGYSSTLLQFLVFAQKHHRSFNVYVLENSPTPEFGHNMVKKLGQHGISSILLADSAAHAMMPKIDKVLISPKCILATGAVIASSGSNLLSLSAKFHRKPFLCVTGLHKLTPEVTGGKHLGDAYDVSKLDLSDLPVGRNVKLLHNSFDLIEPERISLLVTNTGAHQTSYVYRLLSELYSMEDGL